MTDREIRFQSAGVTLAGTFGVPERNEPVPAVLMLPGSGATDRNDNAKALAINAFPQFAAAIEQRGIATLRYDKRGVGASEGDDQTCGFDHRFTDAVAAVEWLRQQPEIDAARIVVLGHSEGASLAIRLAGGAAPVAGAILLAGSAQTGERTLLWQGRKIADSLTGFNKWLLRVLHIDVAKSQRKAFARINGCTADVIRVQGRKVNARWMREFLAYDPAIDLARVNVPVLAITGDHDLQVDPDDLDRMRELVHGPIQTLRLPGVTHVLRTEGEKRGLPGYREQARRPVDPRVISAVTGWLARITDDDLRTPSAG
ncbi:MAG TPA: alpha/beta fold hydrolase [Pseudonocardiaceae bacterium]